MRKERDKQPIVERPRHGASAQDRARIKEKRAFQKMPSSTGLGLVFSGKPLTFLPGVIKS